MYRTDSALRQSFNDRSSGTLKILGDYRFLAPGAIAARERLEKTLAASAAFRDASPAPDRRPGAVRCWLGTRLVRAGVWLAGGPNPAVGIRSEPAQSA